MIQFTVHGTPIPQGSTRAFIPRGWTRPIITADNKKTKPWRQEIASVAQNKMDFDDPIEGAVKISLAFYFDKPKSTSKKVTEKITKPDLDKLCRSVLDALTGICFKDDSQVVEMYALKLFGSPRVEVTLCDLAKDAHSSVQEPAKAISELRVG